MGKRRKFMQVYTSNQEFGLEDKSVHTTGLSSAPPPWLEKGIFSLVQKKSSYQHCSFLLATQPLFSSFMLEFSKSSARAANTEVLRAVSVISDTVSFTISMLVSSQLIRNLFPKKLLPSLSLPLQPNLEKTYSILSLLPHFDSLLNPMQSSHCFLRWPINSQLPKSFNIFTFLSRPLIYLALPMIPSVVFCLCYFNSLLFLSILHWSYYIHP